MFNKASSQWWPKMLSNPRERNLAVALIVVVATGALYRLANKGLGLWDEESLTISRLSSDIERLQQEIDKQESAKQSHLASQAVSLPADSVLAATRYYAWLHEMAGRNSMTEIKIDNTTPVSDSALGSRIQFSIQAKAKPESLGEFIDEFQSYCLLHGITHMQIEDYSPLSQELRVQMMLEVVCLADATETDLPVLPPTACERPLMRYFAENNPFRRYELPKPTTAATVVAVPVIDPLSKVAFVGVVQRDGVRQAWFFDSLNNNEILLKVGAQISIGNFRCQLDALEDSSAALVRDDQQWSIQLGQSIRAALGDTQ